jgi:hypothetical protein
MEILQCMLLLRWRQNERDVVAQQASHARNLRLPDSQKPSAFARCKLATLGAMKNEPFIPRDKPKFFVIGVLAGLSGLATGIAAFVASVYEVAVIKSVLLAVVFLCWLIVAGSFIGFFVGTVTGKYRAMESKPWKDQIW